MNAPYDPLGDAWFEAERGLWRSAAESFERAAEAAGDDPAPLLGQAVCHLRRGDHTAACLLLETHPTLCAVEDPFWRNRITWLTAAARLQGGDPLAAELLVEPLPRMIRLRALASIWLTLGNHAAGVRALLAAMRPELMRSEGTAPRSPR